MQYLTPFEIVFYNANGVPVQGQLKAFMQEFISLPDGSVVQPFDVTFPVYDGTPYLNEARDKAVIIANDEAYPHVPITMVLVDEQGRETQLGDVMIPESQTPVKLASLLRKLQ